MPPSIELKKRALDESYVLHMGPHFEDLCNGMWAEANPSPEFKSDTRKQADARTRYANAKMIADLAYDEQLKKLGG